MSDAPATVWVVDDHHSAAAAIAEIARGLGHSARTFGSAEGAFAALRDEGVRCDVLVTDLRLPGADGLGLLEGLRAAAPGVVVVVVTAFGSVEEAVRAMRAGAHDFLTKPLAVERVEAVLEAAMARARLEAELRRLRVEPAPLRGEEAGLVYRSAAMQAVVTQARRAAASDATVLLLGETGTGKERIARLVHAASARASGPFVAAHLGALADGVAESELFGHERGAFTGAAGRHLGLFEQARRGTLFLDELGEIEPRVQVRLLRVLQERVLVRVGGEEAVKVDARVVAATHRDLRAAVAAGRFREDLFYRLNVVTLRLPPLRERRADIPVLLAHFLDAFAARHGVPVPPIAPAVAVALHNHHWPGNVRELENIAQRLVVMGGEAPNLEELTPGPAAPPAGRHTLLPDGDVDLAAFLDEVERELIGRALARAGGNKASAARALGVSREGLRYKLQKHGIDG